RAGVHRGAGPAGPLRARPAADGGGRLAAAPRGRRRLAPRARRHGLGGGGGRAAPCRRRAGPRAVGRRRRRHRPALGGPRRAAGRGVLRVARRRGGRHQGPAPPARARPRGRPLARGLHGLLAAGSRRTVMTAVVGPALGRDRRAPDGRPPLGAAAGRRAARRRWAWLAAALVLLVLAVVASLALGARAIAPGDVLAALVAPQDGLADHTAVRSLRVPRTLVGLLAGAAFAVAGGVLQSLTRNPLADPGLLGVNAGASLAVVLAVTLLGVTAPAGYVWFALAGAAAAAALVYAVGSSGRLGGAPTTLALAGAALTAGLTSLTTMLVVRDVEAFDAYRFWVVGSLTARGVDAVVALAPFLAAGALAAVA